MDHKQPLWRIARVDLPASRAGLSLMSRAGWWVHKDGRIGRKRQRLREASANAAQHADAPTLKLAT